MDLTTAPRAGFIAARWAPYLFAAGFYAIVTVLMAQPLLRLFGDGIPVAEQRRLENDAVHSLWTVAWSTQAILTDPAGVFNANNFYPERLTLAYSEHYLGVVPFFGPLWALTGNVSVALTIYYLLSFVLTGVCTYALVRTWSASQLAAIFAGLVFAFAPPRLAQHFHIQLLAAWWIPLTLLLLERFLRRPTVLRAALATLSFVMQWLCSVYLGWVLTLAAVIYLIAALIGEPRLVRVRKLWLTGLPAAGVGAAVLLPTLLPYRAVADRWAFQWSLSEIASHSATLGSYLNAPLMNVFWGPRLQAFDPEGGMERELFLGISPIVLAVVGLIVGSRTDRGAPLRRGIRWLVLTSFSIVAICFVLTFGPYAADPPSFPLPYLWLYDWVPGFQAMRNPGRFVVLIALGIGVLGGLGASVLVERLSGTSLRYVGAPAILLIALVELFTILPAERLPTIDAEAVSYLRSTSSEGPILELPMSRDRRVAETPRMFASIFHWRPMVNGFSSFRPPTYEPMAAIFQGSEPHVMADALDALGVRTLVVHWDELNDDEVERFTDPSWRASGFTESLRTSRTSVWTLQSQRTPRLSDHFFSELELSRQVRAMQEVEFRLMFRTEEGYVYRDSVGGSQTVQLSWLPLDSTGVPTEVVLPISLPLLVVERPRTKIEFTATAPSEPGRYRVVLEGNNLLVDRTVTVTRGRAT